MKALYIKELVKDGELHIRAGMNGNWYAFSIHKMFVHYACNYIEKSQKSIYWSKEHQCWTIRVCLRGQKELLRKLKGEINNGRETV